MYDFLKVYPKGRVMVIEIIVDKYINWQPKTDEEVQVKSVELAKIVEEMREYCRSRGITQTIVFDCDKALEFDRLNYVLACKLVSVLTRDYDDPDHTLKRIEIHRCHPAIITIYNSAKVLLPKCIANIFHAYSRKDDQVYGH